MIFETLQIITEQVNNFFEAEGLTQSVVLENVAILDSANEEDDDIDDRVALTLLNMEEETTLKNIPNTSVINDQVTYKNPKVNLNLYILFSANRDGYDMSLRDISKIIEFFQGKRVFTQANTLYNRANITMSGITHFRFIVDLYTPTFEEMNFVWGTLGGRQLPSVMYKISMLEIERNVAAAKGALIQEVTGNQNHINN